MLGSIIGDIAGSVYEFDNIKSLDFEFMPEKSFFTDDTVLTAATAECILDGTDFAQCYKKYFLKYPGRGYGSMFIKWAMSESLKPYNSFGNGSAMRAGPIGFAYKSMDEVLCKAKESAQATHNHPEGIKGAQAVCACIFMARKKESKEEIKKYTEEKFGYDLNFTIDEIRPCYSFDETCQGSVPQAIKAFLESNDFAHAVKLAISLGGDSDTIACISGGIAEAYYGISRELKNKAIEKLDSHIAGIVERFYNRFTF